MKTKDQIIDICNEISSFLIEKNEKYGDRALTPIEDIKFTPIDEIKIRIPDKLK